MIVLRDYQIYAVDCLREMIRRCIRRIILQAETGAGKTVCAAELLRRAYLKGINAIFIAHRRELVNQCSLRLQEHGVPHGLIMSRKPLTPARIQLASKDTLLAWAVRGSEIELPPAQLVIPDECHLTLADQWQKLLAHYSEAIQIGLTATPARQDGKGLGSYYQAMHQAIPTKELIDRGYLVPSDVYAKFRPDMRKVPLAGHDYNQKALNRRMDQPKLVGNVVKEWLRKGGGRLTICFASGISHSMHLVDEFRAHNVKAEHLDGDTHPDDREKILERLAAGETQIVCNVGVLPEGVDVPPVSCAILARPTKSFVLYRQMCLDAQTEILTEAGWRAHSGITPGLRVASFNRQTGAVDWCRPENIFQRPLASDETMYGVSSPYLDIRVTDQHTMLFRSANRLCVRWKTMPASLLAEKGGHFQIPISGQEATPGLPLTDHQLRLIGWFLSDGYLNRSNGSLVISQSATSPYVEEIGTCLADCGLRFSVHRRKRKGKWEGYADGLEFVVSRAQWRSLLPYLDKNLAPSLEPITAQQLTVLLEGMHHGDGAKHIQAEWVQRSYHLSTGNLILAERLQSLCVRRGFKCNLSTHYYNPSPLYVLHIKWAAAANVGGASAKDGRSRLVPVPALPGEMVWCLSTTHGTLIARRNGKVAVLGNCGRIKRPFPGKKDAIVLDHAGAVYLHGHPDSNVAWHLDPTRKIKDPKEPKPPGEPVDIVCPRCGFVFSGTRTCPQCNHKIEKLPKGITVGKDDTLSSMSQADMELMARMDGPEARVRYWHQCLAVMAHRGTTCGAAAQMYRRHYGCFPEDFLPNLPRGHEWRLHVAHVFPQYLHPRKKKPPA